MLADTRKSRLARFQVQSITGLRVLKASSLAHCVRRRWEHLLAPAVVAVFFVIWDLVVRVGGYPAFILPPPGRVWSRFLVVLSDGTLWRHTQATLLEIAAGLALGMSVATVLGYGLAKSRVLERLLSPYVVASQSVPVVAIAPLLIIWFGSGALSKVLICALVVFFPALVNTIVGLRSVDEDLMALMRSLQATRWQIFTMLEVPAALPVLLGGLKVGVTLAVVGAVVGEFVGADQGLGFLINLARGTFDTPLLFVALFTLVAIAVSLYLTVGLMEQRLLAWRGDAKLSR
ncbi:MAG TPA: ABC transporter permease [Anaerolineae bacterium]|nr:ABC transporter permease [Anaerolineae bacterium]